jgi:hypothetical protein
MKPGDLVRNKNSLIGEFGIYLGLRTFKGNGVPDYICAEVIWPDRGASNGEVVSTIQTDLLEVANESR